jgi:hypothetical protein
MGEVSRDTIIQAAKDSGATSRADFERRTGISQYHIYRLFPEGGWSEVQRLAGLDRHPRDNKPRSDEDLLREFHRVVSETGNIPTWAVYSSLANVSADVVRRRFGGTQGTLNRYREWLETNHPESGILDSLDVKSRHEIPTPPKLGLSPSSVSAQWSATDGPVYGSPINFRGLRHSPINEQGVVYLFGMVSYELGMIVESVQSAYPDCEAKRCVDARHDRWQRVRIEFEYRSSNFRQHGHDPTGCDLIVCWEHDWPECPLEVLQLRSVIDDLES